MSEPHYPIFLSLKNQTVLVVGAGSVAARKIPELIHCGATVTVIAPQINSQIKRFSGSILIIEREVEDDDVLGCLLVFACTNSSDVNNHLAELCMGKNLICISGTGEKESSFHSPALLRRGNMAIAIGSGGSAPGLTRHLRQWIEELLPQELSGLAELIETLRNSPETDTKRTTAPDENTIESRANKNQTEIPYPNVQSGAKNKNDWAHLPYRELIECLQQNGLGAARKWLQNWKASQPANSDAIAMGHVYLVGTGPGDPRLITLAALDTIRMADAILYDRLAPASLLAHARKGCYTVEVGKRGHFESSRQEDIHQFLSEQASQGKTVLRLQGGDPFIFGRGWEEVQFLEDQKIPWTVIPGLSSSLAVPALAGIALTHRGRGRSFAVMSGMALSSANLQIPKADSVVVLMGYRVLDQLVKAFLEQGWEPESPLVAIEKGSLPNQRICRTTLGMAFHETAALGFDSPVLLVIGEAARQ